MCIYTYKIKIIMSYKSLSNTYEIPNIDGDVTIDGILTVIGDVAVGGDLGVFEDLGVSGFINTNDSYKLDGNQILAKYNGENLFIDQELPTNATVTAIGNIGIGYGGTDGQSLKLLEDGVGNVAISSSLRDLVDGGGNVGINNAGNTLRNGNNCVFIGIDSDCTGASKDFDNMTSIGAYSSVSAENATAVGQGSSVSGIGSCVYGQGASCTGANSMSLGAGSANGDNNTIQLGNDSVDRLDLGDSTTGISIQSRVGILTIKPPVDTGYGSTNSTIFGKSILKNGNTTSQEFTGFGASVFNVLDGAFYCSGFGRNVFPLSTSEGNSGFGRFVGTSSTGANNSFFGRDCMNTSNLTTGATNTSIGYNTSMTSNYSNCTVLGATAVGRATDSITLGNSDVDVILPGGDNVCSLGNASYRFTDVWAVSGSVNTSDRNKKDNISETALGLDFINDLKPVQYKWKDETQEYDEVVADDDDTKPSKIVKKTREITFKRLHHGLIAQEVKDSMDKFGISSNDFGGYIDTKTDGLGLRYSEFIAPMVKAIQTLSARVEALENQ